MNRKQGYYWVCIKGHLALEVAFYYSARKYWNVIGLRGAWPDEAFEKIIEKKLKEPQS